MRGAMSAEEGSAERSVGSLREQGPSLLAEAEDGAGPALPDEPEAQPRPPAPALLALVGGEAVGMADFLRPLLHRYPLQVQRMLDRVVGGKLAQLEARRLGIVLDPALHAQRYAEDLAEIGAELEREGSPYDLDEYVANFYGLDHADYRRQLSAEARERMLGERSARAHFLTRERVEVRVIVTSSEEARAAVAAGLEAGEDFAALARAHSEDASAQAGGKILALPRDQRTPVSRLAFATEVGGGAGPLALDGGAQVWVLVEARPEPLQESEWARMGPVVEASLRQTPMVDEEFLYWRLAMERHYGIDMAPFYELVGEAGP